MGSPLFVKTFVGLPIQKFGIRLLKESDSASTLVNRIVVVFATICVVVFALVGSKKGVDG